MKGIFKFVLKVIYRLVYFILMLGGIFLLPAKIDDWFGKWYGLVFSVFVLIVFFADIFNKVKINYNIEIKD